MQIILLKNIKWFVTVKTKEYMGQTIGYWAECVDSKLEPTSFAVWCGRAAQTLELY